MMYYPGQIAMTLLLSIIAATGLHAQLKVTRVTGPESLAGKNGIVYSLPGTRVQVDLQVAKTQQFAGPLAEFANEFLGIDDAVTKNSVSYAIVSASIRTCTEPDPGQVYLIEKEEKSQGEIWISFGTNAPVLTLEKFDKTVTPAGFSEWDDDLFQVSETGKLFRKYSDAPARDVIDTIVRKVSIDTLVIEQKILKHSQVEYTDREKAQEASERIRQIEQDKYNLLIGYQETAYSREALEFMYDELEDQRLEYQKLFTGVSITETLNFSLPVYPDAAKEEQEYSLAGFSKTEGLTEPDDDDVITLSLRSNTPGVLSAVPGGEQASTGLVYRVPRSVLAVLSYKGKEIVSKPLEVLQLGMLLTLPPDFRRIEFDLETGGLKSVVME
jgi:hypothetical protein